jgi:hypothetical protein
MKHLVRDRKGNEGSNKKKRDNKNARKKNIQEITQEQGLVAVCHSY